jgi:hypothetical protein
LRSGKPSAVEANGIPVPEDILGQLKVEQQPAGWQLFMADAALHWQPIGEPFPSEPAAENAGHAVLAAAKLLHGDA